MVPPPIRPLLLACGLVLSSSAGLAALQAPAPGAPAAPRPPGSTAARESALLAIPAPDSARVHSRTLSARPHVAGTPAQRATADYVLRRMAGWGLDTLRIGHRVWLPHQDSAVVELLAPARARLRLEEPPIRDDPGTHGAPWPAMNGFSGAGDVSAEVVYVHYGYAEDYATLDSIGVTVKGRVVLARYGRGFRGMKVDEASRRGAVGVLLYSDPWEDGFFRGLPYPEGPTRPADALERGSVMSAEGDPATPGWGATPGARRLPADSLGIPRLPVVPLSARNAERILRGLKGPEVPQPWQGALPLRYRIGGTADARVRVAVWPERGDRAWKDIENTLGVIRGAVWPEDVVILGGHRDSWGPGAADNVSGVSAILEAARAWGVLAARGERPARTLVFATWDAEEWGLVGSTEFVESGADTLATRVVAYLNLDMPAFGPRFAASASASLQPLVLALVREFPQPGDTVSVYAAWRARLRLPADREPSVGDPGSGSDHYPFSAHLGLPVMNFGFGGTAGTYHSAYDTFTWMSRFGDPGFVFHAGVARLAALALARLGDAPILPLDPGAIGVRAGTEVDAIAGAAREAGHPLQGAGVLRAAFDTLAAAGRAWAARRDSLLSAPTPPAPAAASSANRLLREAERQFVRKEGLAGHPWGRNLLLDSDRDRGYATLVLPGLAAAVDDRDWSRAEAEAADLAARALRAAALVREAGTVSAAPRAASEPR